VPEHAGSAPTTGPVIESGVPHELFTTGGVGIIWASLMQATVELPAAGSVNVGGVIVYVYIHGLELPEQSVYVQVYVLVPEHTGSAPITGPVGVTGSPHELITTGGVGSTCASMIQATVEPPLAGSVNVDGETVYVYTHCPDVPVQSVYVQVYVFGPEHIGSAPTTGPVMVNGVPHELLTTGGVGTTCASPIHATVEAPAAGKVKVGGLMVYVYTHCPLVPVQSV
jgi:hypothetical protein